MREIIELESLGSGIPVMPPEAVGFYMQNCMICFQSQGHHSGVLLSAIHGGENASFRIIWGEEVTNPMLRQYADLQDATEHAACAVSFLLIRELTQYTAFERAVKGTTVDYYLTDITRDDDLIFNKTARLEVSGILKENDNNTVEGRIKQKRKRLIPDGSLPTIISVVEFGHPKSAMVTL